MYFWQKPEGVILHDGNFDETKSSLHTCLTLFREWFSYLFSVLRNISYKLEKNGKKIQKSFFITSFAKKNPERKNFEITFSLKRSLHKACKINATMNPIFGLGHEIYELKQKRTKTLF